MRPEWREPKRASGYSEKQRAGGWPLLGTGQVRHRLFGVNYGGQFGTELIVTGKRGNWPLYFDRRYK